MGGKVTAVGARRRSGGDHGGNPVDPGDENLVDPGRQPRIGVAGLQSGIAEQAAADETGAPVVREGRGEEVVQGFPGCRPGKGPVDESQESVGRLPDHFAPDLVLVPEMEVETSPVHAGRVEDLADAGGADPLPLDEAVGLFQYAIACPVPFGRRGCTPGT